MVFHTAPPQPASNARCTWAPELAGGADANQKGFGERMPANSMLRSAIRNHQSCNSSVNGCRGQLAVLNRHHGRSYVSGANAIATRIDARDAGFEVRIHLDVPALKRQTERPSQRGFFLTDGF